MYLRTFMQTSGDVCESTPVCRFPPPGHPLPIKVLMHIELQSLTSAFRQLTDSMYYLRKINRYNQAARHPGRVATFFLPL